MLLLPVTGWAGHSGYCAANGDLSGEPELVRGFFLRSFCGEFWGLPSSAALRGHVSFGAPLLDFSSRVWGTEGPAHRRPIVVEMLATSL